MHEELKQFLLESNRAGYAGGEERGWVKEVDGSTTIVFESGDWRSDDNFFGGEPYGGRTVVFKEGKPYWMMVYYGWVIEGETSDQVYSFLRNALRQMPGDFPYRGPKKHKEGDYSYLNYWDGEVDRFSGEEKIFQGDRLIYKANYLGGLVDQRR